MKPPLLRSLSTCGSWKWKMSKKEREKKEHRILNHSALEKKQLKLAHLGQRNKNPTTTYWVRFLSLFPWSAGLSDCEHTRACTHTHTRRYTAKSDRVRREGRTEGRMGNAVSNLSSEMLKMARRWLHGVERRRVGKLIEIPRLILDTLMKQQALKIGGIRWKKMLRKN